jgi:hypothetical protein
VPVGLAHVVGGTDVNLRRVTVGNDPVARFDLFEHVFDATDDGYVERAGDDGDVACRRAFFQHQAADL